VSIDLFPEVRKLSKTGTQILEKRYFNKALKETSWEQLVDRVVNSIWGNEKEKDIFRQMMLNTYFVPNSPCLVNAGREGAGLSACYVVDFPDTTEGIYKTKLDFALVARKGGGCGTSLEKIRPEGSFVSRSSHGYAGGPLKFANTISHDMDAMTQSGFRSMAIMFTQSVYHPDILKFITAKQEEGVIANANMSVMVDDKFMQAVLDDGEYWTEFNGKKYQKYRAKEVFDLMIEGAWRNGEPGILFRDRINKSPYSDVGEEIFSTNPCSR
jgi:ribonucleoside-diphosphate reductase alpha chain